MRSLVFLLLVACSGPAFVEEPDGGGAKKDAAKDAPPDAIATSDAGADVDSGPTFWAGACQLEDAGGVLQCNAPSEEFEVTKMGMNNGYDSCKLHNPTCPMGYICRQLKYEPDGGNLLGIYYGTCK